MKGGTTTWMIAIAVAALTAAPVAGHAATAQIPSTGPASAADVRETETEQRRLADEHLRKAHAALSEIATEEQPAGVQARISELKRRISTLQHADDTARESAAPPATSPAAGVADRQAELAAIEQTFTALLRVERVSGAPAVPDAPVGTTGASPVLLDDATRAKLEKARTHVTAYAAAMSSAQRIGEKVAAPETRSPAAPAASAPPSAADATAATSPTDPTPTPTGTSPTDMPQTPAVTGTTGTDQPPDGMETARRHLLAARDTLSEMTQMPQAAAITGDARTQVSLLISRFNQLIAADTAWRAALDQVKASLAGLLDTRTAVETPPADVDPVDPAEPVGTAGTITLDPEIRAKLVEFRTYLEAFERAAGGAPPGAAEPLTDPSDTTAAPGAVATRASETDPTTASGSTSTGAPAADMPSPTADAVGGEPMRAGDPIASEALRHIEAIETILVHHARTSADGATGTSGTQARDPATPAAGAPALDPEHVAEIRAHLDELRRLVESRGR